MLNVEGTRRMMRAGKFFIFGGLASALLIIAFAIVIGRLGYAGMYSLGLAAGVYLAIFPALIGTALWICGWIIEGFLIAPPQE